MSSSAALNLQCPACGGVFLTLQQGTGGAEICPHCSMSAPRSRYRPAEAQSGPVARTVLPPRKNITASQPIPLAPAAYYGPPTGHPVPGALPPVRQQAQPFNAGQSYRPSQATGPVPLPVFAQAPAPASGPVPIPISSEPPPTVVSERVSLPPLAPGQPPLPSRVLHSMEPDTPASYAAAHREAPSGPVAAAPAALPAPAPPPQHSFSPALPLPAVASSPFAVATTPEPDASPFSAEASAGPAVPAHLAASPEPLASPYFAASPEPLASPYFVPAPEPEPEPEVSPFSAAGPETVVSPFSAAVPPPVPEPVTVSEPALEVPASNPSYYSAPLPQDTAAPMTAPPVMSAPVIPPLEVPPASVPSYEYPQAAVVTSQPQLQPPPESYYSAPPVGYHAAALPVVPPVPASVPLPVPEPKAAAPIPTPAPSSIAAPAPLPDPALAAKASPAQLWEAAILQHNQSQEAGGALTGRELFPAGSAFAFQPAPAPLPAPLPFGPLVAPPGATSPVLAPTLPPPTPVHEAPAPVSHTPVDRPLVTGTVLPSSRSMPPSVLPAGFAALPAVTLPPTQPPPQIGFVPESQTAQPAAPASTDLPPSSPFAMVAMGSPLAPSPLPAPPGLSMQSAPLVPHAVQLRDSGVVVNLGPAPEDSPPHAASQGVPLVPATVVRKGPPPLTRRPARLTLPWIAGLLLGSLALAGGLHFLKDKWVPATKTHPASLVQASNAKAPTPQAASNTGKSHATATTPQAMDAEIAATPTALTPASAATPPSAAVPAPGQEEVRRAMPSDPATLSITQEDPLPAIATKLMLGIDTATSPEDRARWIENPEKNAAHMERLVRMRGGRLNTREVTPLPAPVYMLPSGEEVPLFRVSSPASRGGAILRLHPQNGGYVIDWPLFAQTYDNSFDRFVATNRAIAGKAEWYTVLCSLVGDPASKEAQRETHLRLQVQGSLAETGSTEAWVEKTSRAGRYLLKEMTPRRMYLVEMQFGASDAGSRRLMILDCGATRGESAQANANK